MHILTYPYPAIAAVEVRHPARIAPITGEGHGVMYSVLALSFFAHACAWMLSEFDPSKTAQFVILIILGVSGVFSVFITALIKAIREFRKLIGFVKQLRSDVERLPSNVGKQVTKVIEDSPLPTTPEQVRASDERIANAVVAKQIPIVQDTNEELHKIKHTLVGVEEVKRLKAMGDERGIIDETKP